MPGLVFQSVVIGGGYATGRELIEFFGALGPRGGVLGMLVTMAVFSAVLAISFELARSTRSFEYRSFFRTLLGPLWPLFEIAYALLLVLVLAVIGAASGELLEKSLGAPKLLGTIMLMALIAGLVFRAGRSVERALAWGGIGILAVFAVLAGWSLVVFGDRVAENFNAVPVQAGWLRSGVTYSAYNMATLVAVLFCLRGLETRRQAVIAGLLAGPLTMLPGLLFFVLLMGFYPAINAVALPSVFVAAQLGAPWFERVFELTVLWALVATGVGLIHAINERICGWLADQNRREPRALRPGVALLVMSLSVFAADAVGLVGLIARGYGVLTWAFVVLLLIPVLTIGLWKVFRSR